MKKSKYYTPNYFRKVVKFNLCLIIVLNLSFLKNSYCNDFFLMIINIVVMELAILLEIPNALIMF